MPVGSNETPRTGAGTARAAEALSPECPALTPADLCPAGWMPPPAAVCPRAAVATVAEPPAGLAAREAVAGSPAGKRPAAAHRRRRGGLEPAEQLGGPAYEGAAAGLQVLVWEAEGRVFALVGELPAGELRAMARSGVVPQPATPGVGERLGRGLQRLGAWLSP